ncbi:uncharacterized protein LOC143449815 [Clavelina lepadiformis]|uniref:uncharacterized protein LOC143449815 n=1 Tax=Clavelina lepadiformis TaxID=159417 RepID=UPI004040F1C3
MEYLCKTLGINLVHSLPFRPSCLGFLDRTLERLKGALRTCEFPKTWTDERVYGSTLQVPGQFFEALDEDTPSSSQYVNSLTAFMATLRCTPPVHHATPPVYIDKNLADCTHVIVRFDASRSSLSPPHAGSYKVLAKYDKYFTLATLGKLPNVSVDRLKVAHLLIFESVHVANPPMKEADLVDEVVHDADWSGHPVTPIEIAEAIEEEKIVGRSW